MIRTSLLIILCGLIFSSFLQSSKFEKLAAVSLSRAFDEKTIVPDLTYQDNTSLGIRNVALGGGGYVTGIYLHPQEKDLIYIKTDVGGFYRWDADKSRWVPLTDRFSLAQSNYYGGESLALDPHDPAVVYIATGKYTADWAKSLGTIFKSTDRGSTWTKLNIDLKMGGNEDLRWVGERLVVNPWNSQEIFFGSRLDGLWKSADAGQSWNRIPYPGKAREGIGITSVVFDSQKSNVVYSIAYGDGIYRSRDGGLTWKQLSGSPNLAKRMVSAPNGVLYVTHDSGVSRYKDERWQEITPAGVQGSFNAIDINPQQPDQVLVSLGETANTRLFESLDGGATWAEKARSVNNTVAWWSEFMTSQPWISAIAFDRHVPGRVWLTDWYGIWQTNDVQANPVVWTNYQQGHEEVVTFTLVSPPQGSLLLSGVADVDGFYHNQGLDSPPSQSFGRSGPAFQDTYSIAYCQREPLEVVRVGGNRFNSTFTGATSSDGGMTWTQFGSFPANTMPTRVAVSASQPDRFIVTISAGQPLLTNDGGRSWTKISGLPDGFSGPWNWSQPLAADGVDGNIFYYYADGEFYRSIDAGASFKAINTQLSNEYWFSVKTIPGVTKAVWISLNQDGLYQSQDGGETFTKLDQVERAYLFSFGKPEPGSTTPALYLYGNVAGMGEGIFRSLNLGKTWTRLGNPATPIGNDPNVMEASWQKFGLVFVGTNGRGIYYGSK